MNRPTAFWAIVAALSLVPATLFAQTGETTTASPWIEIVRNLGVPTTFLAFFVWYHLQRQKSHETAIRAKDDEITRLGKDKDTEIARINKENSAELSRVNELRVKEAQENANRLFQRDKESMTLLAEADKTLTMILEKLR